VRLQLSDAGAAPGLIAHLVRQGFPARRVAKDVVDVLFPAEPSAFAAATELDLWTAANTGVAVVPIRDRDA
jgi:hypothetical protein